MANEPVSEGEKWQRRFERERSARKSAEKLLEEKSRELFETNEKLIQTLASLENTVDERTRELRTALNRVEESSQEKTAFLNSMSHEIWTPINGISGMLDLLSSSELDASQRKHLGAATTSTRHLKQLLTEILELTSIGREEEGVAVSEFDVGDLLDAVVTPFAASLKESAVSLIVHVDPKLNVPVIGPKLQLIQILEQVIENAVAFTPRGTIEISVLGNASGKNRQSLHFSVSDTGIGIEEKHLSRIFEEFYQVDSSLSRKTGGAGIGLALTKKLVEKVGGAIGVESVPDAGTTVWFSLPVSAVDISRGYVLLFDRRKRARSPGQATPPVTGRDGMPVKVLIADDNQVNLEVLRRHLEALGASVDEAVNGKEAVSAASDRRYDLVLLDLQMPVLDGISATRDISRACPKNAGVPIYIVTADGTQDVIEVALAAGARGCIEKPVRKSDIEDLLLRAKATRKPTVIASRC